MLKSLFNLIICVAATALVLSSCSGENSETIEEIIEEIPDGLEVDIRGDKTTYDAYAAYCRIDGVESFSVSNNPDLLNNDIWAESLKEDDFIIHYRKDSTTAYTVSGATFEIEFMGQPILIVAQDLDNDVIIEEANSVHVIGSLEGEFIVNPQTGEQATYAAKFAAEVDPDIIPVLCN